MAWQCSVVYTFYADFTLGPEAFQSSSPVDKIICKKVQRCAGEAG